MVTSLTDHNKYKIRRYFSLLISPRFISFAPTTTILCQERICVIARLKNFSICWTHVTRSLNLNTLLILRKSSL